MKGVGLTPPSYQDLRILPKHVKWLKAAQMKVLADPGKGVEKIPSNTREVPAVSHFVT